MRHCPECDLDLTGALDHCPLCGSPLKGTPSPTVFPYSKLERPRKLARRSMIILTLAALALVIMVGLLAGSTVATMGAGCAAVLITYVFVRNVIVHSPSALRMIERYFLVLIALSLLLFFATGDTKVATYLVPVVSMIALATNGVLVILFRNTFVQGYAKYLLFELVLGLVPLLLLAFGVVSDPLLTIITAVMAALLLLLMLTLTRKQLDAEVHKLFHT